MIPDPQDDLNSLQEEIGVLVARKAYTEAAARTEAMLSLLIGNPQTEQIDLAGCRHNLGWLHEKLGEWDKAQSLYEEAIGIIEHINGAENPDLLPALDGLAGFYRRRARYLPAEELYRRMWNIFRKANAEEQPQCAACLNELAITLKAQGKYEEADELYQKVLGIIEKALGPQSPDLGSAHGNLATLYQEQGRYDAASTQLDRMEAIFRNNFPEEHPAWARFFTYRSTWLASLGRFAEAERLDRRVLAIREKESGDKDVSTAAAAHDLASSEFRLGWLEDAETLFRRALTLREQEFGATHPDTLATCNGLAAVLEAKRSFPEAEKLFRRALVGRESLFGAQHPATLGSLSNLAALLEQTGRYGEASGCYERAIKGFEQTTSPDPRLASFMNNRALLYTAMGEYDNAAALYDRALAVAEANLGPEHPIVGDTLMNYANLHWVRNNLQVVRELMERANQIYEQHLSSLLSTGAERQKRTTLYAAIANLHAAVTLHTTELGKDTAARKMAAQLVLQRKGRLVDALRAPVATLRRYATEENIALLEQLVKVRTQRSVLTLTGSTTENRENITKLIATLRAEEERLELLVGDRSLRHDTQMATVTLNEVCAKLSSGTALLEYFRFYRFLPSPSRTAESWGAPRYVAYMIRPDGVTSWSDLGSADEIDDLSLRLRSAIVRESDTSYLARELYRRLVSPFQNEIESIRNLLISPDGQLSLVPFAALLDANGRYLVGQVTVSYLSSGRDLLSAAAVGTASSEPLILTDPDFGEIDPGAQERWRPLPGTAREEEILTKLLSRGTFLGREAVTKEAFTDHPRPILLHVATHGDFLPDLASPSGWQGGRPELLHRSLSEFPAEDNPLLRSRLMMAGANRPEKKNESQLTALEVIGLDLQGTELVTLSACSTGVGTVRAGDGVYGMRRAFELAGARSLLISLWRVDDERTAELMSRIYGRLFKGQGRAEALCEVQREFIKERSLSHPRYWAAFILTGDTGQIKGLEPYTRQPL